MIKNLKNILEILESKINPDQQNKIFKCHQRTLNWEHTDRLPLIVTFPFPKSSTIQPFPHHEIFDNPEKMLYNELVYAFDTSIWLHTEIGDDLPFTIRANFGTVIIASHFGGIVEYRDNNPPWVRHFNTLDEFETIFNKDPMDFSRGLCAKVVSRYKFYRDVLSDYPNLQKSIKVVLPDLQGPLDSLELLRGSCIYEDFIMKPELVERGLKLMAFTQVGFAKHLHQFISDEPQDYSHQHATTIKGNILIRNDSAIMISPEMYTNQVASYDEFVLNEMNGGGIHSCGRIDFNVPEIFQLNSIKCFDFGQSYLNDFNVIYPLALTKKISLIRIKVDRDELLSGKIQERFPTGVSLVYDSASIEEAQFVAKTYKNL
jgi:hypothetical protein